MTFLFRSLIHVDYLFYFCDRKPINIKNQG